MGEFKEWLSEFVESTKFKVFCFVLDVTLVALLVANLVS